MINVNPLAYAKEHHLYKNDYDVQKNLTIQILRNGLLMDPSGIEPDTSAFHDIVCRGSALPDELWAHNYRSEKNPTFIFF